MAIQSILHTGLRTFATTGDASGIRSEHVLKLNHLLAELSFSAGVIPGLKKLPGFHAVKRMFPKAKTGIYAVKVSKSWRLTFQISAEGDIAALDYVQYH